MVRFIVFTAIVCAQFIQRSYCCESGSERPSEFIRTEFMLKSLIDAEEALYHALKDLVKSGTLAENGHTALELEATRFFEDIEDNSGYNLNKTNDPEKYGKISASPHLGYRMIYRCIKQIPTIIDMMSEVEESDALHNRAFLEYFYNQFERNGATFPQQSDLDDAAEDILRIIHFYDLDIDEFAQGRMARHETGFVLQAKHCLEIAKYASRSKKYVYLAIELFEYTETLLDRPPGSFLSRTALQKDLDSAINLHDEEWDRLPKYEEEFFLEKVKTPNRSSEFDLITESGYKRRPRRRTALYDYFRGQVNESRYNDINFWGLCFGDDLLPESEKSKLSCWYDLKSHPVRTINPLKIELLSRNPHIIQIYEFLSDQLIEKLINITQAVPFEKSKVVALKKYDREWITKNRTSYSKWMNEDQPDFLQVSKRIEHLTGLSVSPFRSSENWQIAAYSFGQHYASHRDALGELSRFHPEKGERIATFMIYLSNVELGGYTAFTEALVAAKPVKGSAVFWYNLKRNGEFDMRTSHGACAVLAGNKLVANKWIRSKDQFLRRQCQQNE